MIQSHNMIETGNKMMKAYICKVCGKEATIKNIKDHIEINNLEGINIPCTVCGNNFRNRRALRYHKTHHHQNNGPVYPKSINFP